MPDMQLLTVIFAPAPDTQIYLRQEADNINLYIHGPNASDGRGLEIKWDGAAFTFSTIPGVPAGLPIHLGDDGQLVINKGS